MQATETLQQAMERDEATRRVVEAILEAVGVFQADEHTTQEDADAFRWAFRLKWEQQRIKERRVAK